MERSRSAIPKIRAGATLLSCIPQTSIVLASVYLLVLAWWHMLSNGLGAVSGQPTAWATAPVCWPFFSMLAGLGLLSVLGPRTRRLALLCGTALVIGGVVMCIDHASGALLVERSLRSFFAPQRLSVRSAGAGSDLPFSVVGAALVALAFRGFGRRGTLLGTLGSLVGSIGLIEFVSEVSGIDHLSGADTYINMPPYASLGFVFLGAALVARAWQISTRSGGWWPRWLPILIGLISVAASVCIFEALVGQENVHIIQKLELTGEAVRDRVSSEVGAHMLGLLRLARDWKEWDCPTAKNWETEAAEYRRVYPGLQGVGWIDPFFSTRWIASAVGNRHITQSDSPVESGLRRSLEKARDGRSVIITPTFPSLEGGRSFMVYVPIFQNEEFGGFVLVIIQAHDYLQSILKETREQSFSYAINDMGKRLYASNDYGTPASALFSIRLPVTLYGVQWNLLTWITPRALLRERSVLPGLALLMGLAMSLIIIYTVRTEQSTRLRLAHLLAFNRELEDQIARRRRAEGALRAEAERLSAIVHTQQEIAVAQLDLDRVMGLVVERIQQLTGASGAAIWFVDRDELVCGSACGASLGLLNSRRKAGVGIASECLSTGRAVLSLHAATDPRILIGVYGPDVVNSVAVVPVGRADDIACVLEVVSEQQGAFSDTATRTLQLMGGMLAAAVDLAQAFRVKQELLTERTNALSALLESEERFRAVSETASDAIISVDEAGCVTYFNRAAEEVFGYTATEVLQTSVTGLVSSRYRRPVLRRLSRIVQRGRDRVPGTTMELTARRRNGVEFPAEMSVSVWKAGGNIYVTGILRDVTDRKRGEIALRDSEHRFRFLAENSTDIISRMDVEGVHLYVSPASRRLIGYDPEELIGHACFTFWHHEDVDNAQQCWRELLESPDGHTFAIRVRHKNGHYVWLETTGRRVTTEDGRLTEIHATSRDITQRKHAEEELRMFAAQLEQSNRELQEFAGVASHDLQEPLRKIQAFAGRLRAKLSDSLSEEGTDYLDRMERAAARMQGLINDLVVFSRVTFKGQPFTTVNLNDLIQEVVGELQLQIRSHSAEIEVGNLPTIEADRIQMKQLLFHLVDNALKFHKPDVPPVIRIFAKDHQSGRAAAGRMMHLSIQDNGLGFDEKYLDRIFAVFERLHGRSEYDGTGIGLAVCKKIVERHAGSITARSTPGEGTTFLVVLPYRQLRGDDTV